jgi:tetratricopeptide (TPR) repeat protein
MSYTGNASLSSAVKDRVVSTFQQAVALYQQGRKEEVLAGCTLILQMDPMFEPAKKLLEKTRNPALPIDINTLLPPAQQDTRSPMQQAREAMAERDFQRVIQLTSGILSEDLLNDEARILGDDAREKLEAAPFVEQFTRRCDQSIGSGNIAAAKMELEKARALDPTHPDVVRIGRALAARAAEPTPVPVSQSFIVDEPSPSATGRPTAQAADFGFAFEEEKPAEISFENFAFDAPAEPTAAAAPSGFSFDTPSAPSEGSFGNEFDFATASVATTTDDQKKIDQYLTDGDRAFEGGDYQQAIDLWSRIFLIDVTNEEASDRIERAKAKRRATEQKIEPLLSSGILAFEQGNTTTAHADLSEVLRLDPGNTTAQQYLNRLGETVVEGGATATSQTYAPSRTDEGPDLSFFEEDANPELSEAPLVPPAPGSAGAATATSASSKAKAGKKAAPAKATARKVSLGPIAAILGLLVLGAAGWFVWTRFMNAPQEDTGAGQALIARATTLSGAGKYDQAIALLQDIKPGDRQHDQALVMIADLRKKKSGAAQLIDGIPAEQFYTQQLAAAQTAFAAHDYAVAKTAFDQAMRAKPLSPELKTQYDLATAELSKLNAAKALMAEHKYADAIANLEPLLTADPQNQTIRRMLVNAHFNAGATALQEQRLNDATREFDEVLKMNPDDELAKRSRDLAARYTGATPDLLYKIYVKYLPLRTAT